MSSPSVKSSPFQFPGFGVEIEYMIVNRDSLDVRPIAGVILRNLEGETVNSLSRGNFSWSNELVRHVIELKTSGPSKSLKGLMEGFHEDVVEINKLLEGENAALMPGGIHPWMDPFKETSLWLDEDREIYEAFNRVFDCRGHGWSNLQSVHLNLPFTDDDSFRRLHSAIRILLPVLPALTASSPCYGGKLSEFLDGRLDVYRRNCSKIPSITGKVIPEIVRSREEYQDRILKPMYRDIAPHDPDGILQEEWLNARGAIARFDRGTIEIRTIDTQESPRMDLGILAFVEKILIRLIDEVDLSIDEQESASTEDLAAVFDQVIREGRGVGLAGTCYEKWFPEQSNVQSLLNFWLKPHRDEYWYPEIQFILEHGNLAERLIPRLIDRMDRDGLMEVYRKLIQALKENDRYRR